LRAVAVSLVVLYHAGLPHLEGGFIGVDIFFVLSGYLITSLLIKELNSSGGINLSRFYARRVRRLLPASSLVVAVVCVTSVVLYSPLKQIGVLKAALATTLYGSNLYFWHAHLPYFSRYLASSPLLHTWSLAVEEQFYLVWPIFLLLLARTVKSAASKLLIIAAITAVSFAGCIWLSRSHQVAAFFQSPPRAWEFSIGAMLVFIPSHWLTARETLCGWLGVAGLFSLVLSGALIAGSASYPGYVAAIPVLATLATLQAGAGAPTSVAARLLNLRPLQYIGGISYSLYLWHWPVLMIAAEIFPAHSAATRAACTAVAVLLAAITHVTLENPIRFNAYLVSRPLRTLGMAGLLMVICIGGLTMWWIVLDRSPQFRKFNKIRNDIPSFYASGCAVDAGDATPKLCSFGEISHAESTVVLFGDSHAAQWFPALKAIAESRHWKLVTVIKLGCPPMNVKALTGASTIEACAQWRNRAVAAIGEMRPELVVLASSSLYPQRNNSTLIDASEWEKGSRDTFLAVAREATALRFIRDTPSAGYDVVSCLSQLDWNGHAACPPVSRARALNSDMYQAEIRAAAGIANLKIIDMSDAICGKQQCETQQDGIVKFRDGDHLTSSYVETLTNVLETQLLRSLE